MSPLFHEIATGTALFIATCAAILHLRRMVRPRCSGCASTPTSAETGRSARGIRSPSLKVLGRGRA
ncbi:MAG: hypothetical protein ACPHRO_01680 [Nannocystaceae bacterium]